MLWFSVYCSEVHGQEYASSFLLVNPQPLLLPGLFSCTEKCLHLGAHPFLVPELKTDNHLIWCRCWKRTGNKIPPCKMRIYCWLRTCNRPGSFVMMTQWQSYHFNFLFAFNVLVNPGVLLGALAFLAGALIPCLALVGFHPKIGGAPGSRFSCPQWLHLDSVQRVTCVVEI